MVDILKEMTKKASSMSGRDLCTLIENSPISEDSVVNYSTFERVIIGNASAVSFGDNEYIFEQEEVQVDFSSDHLSIPMAA